MKIDELIQLLEGYKEEHGNIDVYYYSDTEGISCLSEDLVWWCNNTSAGFKPPKIGVVIG